MTAPEQGAPGSDVAGIAAGNSRQWLCIGRKHGGWRCYSRCMYEYWCAGSGCGGETLAPVRAHITEQSL